MFTGIVESQGRIVKVRQEGANCHFQVSSDFSASLQADQSVNHDGICLTVTRVDANGHWVTAVDETMQRTTCGSWTVGRRINLERSMKSDGRFEGHIVQGHVDGIVHLINKSQADGSWLFDFSPLAAQHRYLVEKGSATLNGVSLTCFNVSPDSFRVALIPHTHSMTNLGSLEVGDSVNLEVDILGKYVARLMDSR